MRSPFPSCFIVLPALAMVLLPGCLDGAPAQTTPDDTLGATVSNGEQSLLRIDLTRCDEINLLRRQTSSRILGLGELPPPLRTKSSDPAGLTVTVVDTFMRCASAQTANASATDVTGRFLLVPVEPLPDALVPNATSYLYLRALAASNPILVDAFLEAGVRAQNATVTVEFPSSPGDQKSRGLAVVRYAMGTSLNLETLMTGAPAAGSAGVLGLYTAQVLTIRAHRVEFSDYRFYANGAGWALLRAGTGGSAEAWPATHNLDYGVSFEFDAAAPIQRP